MNEEISNCIGDIRKKLEKTKEILLAAIYGSVVRGEYSPKHSDIDLFIVINKEKKDEKAEEEINKLISQIGARHMVRIHPEYQYLAIEEEDKTLIQKIMEEGQILINNGVWILAAEKIGLRPFWLVQFSTKETNQNDRVRLSQALHGNKKWYYKGKKKIIKSYKGLIDNVKIYEAGAGSLLVDDKLVKDTEILFKRLNVKHVKKKVFFG